MHRDAVILALTLFLEVLSPMPTGRIFGLYGNKSQEAREILDKYIGIVAPVVNRIFANENDQWWPRRKAIAAMDYELLDCDLHPKATPACTELKASDEESEKAEQEFLAQKSHCKEFNKTVGKRRRPANLTTTDAPANSFLSLQKCNEKIERMQAAWAAARYADASPETLRMLEKEVWFAQQKVKDVEKDIWFERQQARDAANAAAAAASAAQYKGVWLPVDLGPWAQFHGGKTSLHALFRISSAVIIALSLTSGLTFAMVCLCHPFSEACKEPLLGNSHPQHCL
eukprot:gnl/MRDRNA2_/MRDRNA2_218308_c0_seq1.p1 gnl/MRDRNA2_/MRDRNA2_218308_c0~~gnl/MRDRNA2_/MRDRNA2_218308_c0_seq1.p1  ORF type:complete len:285 (-),score=57.79 gnl/MRDRNA2_/MRDRNA2_218308_c0_seq1:159-1013(-)